MFKKKPIDTPTPEYVLLKLYAQVNTCCECKIYIDILQTYDYKYRIETTNIKICDLHTEAALAKHTDRVRSKLI